MESKFTQWKDEFELLVEKAKTWVTSLITADLMNLTLIKLKNQPYFIV